MGRGQFRYLGLVLAATVSLLVVRRDRDHAYTAVALIFIISLVMTSGWGAQYMAWVVPFGMLAHPGFATAYNVVGGTFLSVLYKQWSDRIPWDVAVANWDIYPPVHGLGLLTWWLLILWGLVGFASLFPLPQEVRAQEHGIA